MSSLPILAGIFQPDGASGMPSPATWLSLCTVLVALWHLPSLSSVLSCPSLVLREAYSSAITGSPDLCPPQSGLIDSWREVALGQREKKTPATVSGILEAKHGRKKRREASILSTLFSCIIIKNSLVRAKRQASRFVAQTA